MKKIFIALLFLLLAGAANRAAYGQGPVKALPSPHLSIDPVLLEPGTYTEAAKGTYVFLFVENHNAVIEMNDLLLRKIESVRSNDKTVYIRYNDQILIKVFSRDELASNTFQAPASNFVFTGQSEFDELVKESIY